MFTSSNSGISLITVVVMVGVLGISLTVTRLLLYHQTSAHRESETRREMKEIYEAIMGRPEMGTFGYVGDMGGFPDNLTALVEKATQPDYEEPKDPKGIKYGWNGPYINTGRDLESYRKDAWGNEYAIVGVAQIRSNGLDGVADTPDDIVFPTKPPDSFIGFLEVKIPKGGVLCNQSDITDIVVYYSENGIEKSTSLGTDINLSDVEGEGFYATNQIPLHHGIHAVEVGDTFNRTVFANVTVFAGSTNTQIAGTFPHEGIDIPPLFPPHISLNDLRVVEVNIVNTTGCQEGEGVPYDISRIDITEIGGVEDHNLLEISFNSSDVVYTDNTGISISHDIDAPTSINLSGKYRLQPGQKSLNELKFHRDVSPDTTFVLTYHYTNTEEPEILENSTISFRPQ